MFTIRNFFRKHISFCSNLELLYMKWDNPWRKEKMWCFSFLVKGCGNVATHRIKEYTIHVSPVGNEIFITCISLSRSSYVTSSFHFCFWKVATLSMDPLGWKGGLKAKWAMSMYDAMEKVKHNLPRIEWPFLVCHGDADQLTMVEGSMMLEQKAASKDKTIKVMVKWLLICLK